jgi:hypothetical protein
VFTEVNDTADCGEDGADKTGATATKANDFAMDTILLGGESVCGEGGSIEFRN